MTKRPAVEEFRNRLLERDSLLGTFLKIPTTQVVEILGTIGYDFVVIDQEHAALDRGITDLMILAARASGIAPLVRISDPPGSNLLPALDCGALGIMFPHVSSAEKAREVVRQCRYQGGTRGFGALNRASGWGRLRGIEHMRTQDSQVACIVMIEDTEAVASISEIAAVEGIDAIFIGRADLTATFGDDPDAASKVAEMSETVARAARDAGVPLMILAGSREDADHFGALGASALLVSSDHNFVKSAASDAAKLYRSSD